MNAIKKINTPPPELMSGEIMTNEKIVKSIYGLWGSSELVIFLNGFMMADHSKYETLSLGMFSELNSIISEHDKQFPHLSQNKAQVWY